MLNLIGTCALSCMMLSTKIVLIRSLESTFINTEQNGCASHPFFFLFSFFFGPKAGVWYMIKSDKKEDHEKQNISKDALMAMIIFMSHVMKHHQSTSSCTI